MASQSQLEQRAGYVRSLEYKLQHVIKGSAPTFEEIDHLISQLRVACESVIFFDFKYATEHDVEKVLWASHILINSRYRKLVESYKKGEQRKLSIERRKLEKRYADFIKTSQYFYKGYIQRLASHFEGMTGLYKIAHRLSLNIASVNDRVQVAPDVQQMIENSCHATLLRLGDLSRYRNNLRTKDRSWAPALAYYALANDLFPDSGSAHNQMSVISLQEGNHLDGIYHIYRALCIKNPHALAKGNLELEFKKVVTNNTKPRAHSDKTDSLGTLTNWFTLLHAKFYEGVDFTTHDELENEVLSRLALLLKEQNFEDVLEKFVLINIAAEDFAGEKVRLSDPPDATDFQALLFTLAFNVRFMFVLLQTLQPELEDHSIGEDIPNGSGTTTKSRERITATCRRVLPALRQYSLWLTTRAKIILAIPPGPITIHVKELWKMYADVLTRLVGFFPIEDLQESPYLLEEDARTVGFRPFREPEIPGECNYFIDHAGFLKPRITDRGIERNHPNVEMQARALNIILVGLQLQLGDDYPLALSSVTGSHVFTYVEEGLSLATPVRPQSSREASSRSPLASQQYSMPPPAPAADTIAQEDSYETAESHYSLESEMHRMVEKLVDNSAAARYTPSNETSYGMHSQTADDVFAPLASNGAQRSVHQATPKIIPNLPSLPGIWSSPFTPQPNELKKSVVYGSLIGPSDYATDSQRIGAAQQLDRMTGRGSWEDGNHRPQSRPSPKNEILQESPSLRYPPQPFIRSSNFTDSSSLYAGTPAQQHIRRNMGYGQGLNNSTYYPGATDFDRHTLLNSSIWNGSQNAPPAYSQTPPGGQGG